jgi:hypothetical protein
MTLPAGVSTATVSWGKLVDFAGQGAAVSVKVTPLLGGNAQALTYEPESQTLIPFPQLARGDFGVAATWESPHVDQDGFIDGAGNTVKNWSYVAVATVTSADLQQVTLTKTYQVFVGQDAVNLDLVPDGTVAAPTSAPRQDDSAQLTELETRVSVLESSEGQEGAGGLAYESYDGAPAAIKLIVYADNSIRAVPASATRPSAPSSVTDTASVQNVLLSWASVSATSYEVWRNGTKLATAADTKYRDWAVSAGPTYSYQVRAVNEYGMVSAFSDAVSVFVNPALNNAPTASVSAWPPVNTPGQKQVIRVSGSDVDGQVLAYTLSVDKGTLEPTADPSVWYLTLPVTNP